VCSDATRSPIFCSIFMGIVTILSLVATAPSVACSISRCAFFRHAHGRERTPSGKGQHLGDTSHVLAHSGLQVVLRMHRRGYTAQNQRQGQVSLWFPSMRRLPSDRLKSSNEMTRSRSHDEIIRISGCVARVRRYENLVCDLVNKPSGRPSGEPAMPSNSWVSVRPRQRCTSHGNALAQPVCKVKRDEAS